MNLADKMKKVMQGIKVVDKIDLDTVPEDVHPKKASKEDKKYMRRMQELRDEAHNTEMMIADLEKQYVEDDLCSKAAERKRKQLRKEFLEKRMKVREKYDNLELSNNERQRDFHFQGIRPQPMDVVHFHTLRTHQSLEPYDGVALVRDENHYYIAVDLYNHPEQEDNITSCMDENPDNTFEGIWPADTCLSKPSVFEERMMRRLVDKYADDIEKAKAFIEGAQQRDIDESIALGKDIYDLTQAIDAYGEIYKQMQEKRARLASIKEEMDALTLELNVAKSQTEQTTAPEVATPETAEPEQTKAPLVEFVDVAPAATSADPVQPPMRNIYVRRLTPPDLTPTEQRYPHLAFVRMKRDLQDMDYPFIDLELKPWLRFRLMANVARVFDRVGRTKSLTYVLSNEYMEELKSRAARAYRGMTPESVVPRGEMARGVIVFPHQDHEDTVLYDINNNGNLTILLVYIREGKLMFYESYTTQQIIGAPRIDNYMCKSMKEAGTDITRLFNFIRNFVVSFLAMECDMQRTMKHFVEDGQAEEVIREVAENEPLNFEQDEDVVIRDSNWYSSISVDHLIPVQGYVSHRWVGTGKEKVLQEVWVRPHSRNGYHREAGVMKQ